MRSSLLAVVLTGLCLTNTSAQQPQTPAGQPAVTFKTEVNYVDVDTIVTDQQGNFVKGLTRDDFQLLEDGKPQKVEMFSYVDLPVDRPERLMFGNRPVSPDLGHDVRTNGQSLAGRMYVLVLDDLDTSMFRTEAVRRAARQFIDRNLGTNDVGAVIYTSGRTDAAQEFTNDRELLQTAVSKFIGRKLRSSTLDKIDTYFQVQSNQNDAAAAAGTSGSTDTSGPAPNTNSGAISPGSSTDPSINPNTRGDGYPDRTFDSEDLERGQRALNVLNELKDLADFMGNIHGRRKALLLFSEGIDYETSNIFGAQDATAVVRATQDAITAAARGNVSIFGVDPRGLVGMSADEFDLTSSPGMATDPYNPNNPGLAGFGAEMRLSQGSLQSLSEETGGFASVDSNDPSKFFDRVVNANSTYYVLGYYPPSHPRDGRFHKIEVRVTRPGLKVTARKGYADPRGKTPEERDAEERAKLARDSKRGGADNTSADLRAMLNSPMQQGGVTMAVQAAPFKNTPKESSVAIAIEMDASKFQFEKKSNGTVFADKIELSYFPLDEQGKPQQGMLNNAELTLRPESYERARQVGFRINPRIALAPGRYQLRIGVREAGAGVMGTVFYDINVPDFAKEPLSMSGVLLTAATSQLVQTLVPDKLISAQALPGPATSRRTFAQGDTLALYAEVYDNIPAKQIHTLTITTSLLGEDGHDVFTSRETHDGKTLQGAANASTLGYSKQIPLKDVPPGRYLLQVNASASGDAKNARPVTEELLVTVAPASAP